MKADAGCRGDVVPERVALVASRWCVDIKSYNDPDVLSVGGAGSVDLGTGGSVVVVIRAAGPRQR